MPNFDLPGPPIPALGVFSSFTEADRVYLNRLTEWTRDLLDALNKALEALDKDKQGKSLPIEVPAASVAQLSGSAVRFRPGGPPALIYVTDEAGGPTIAFRDGAAWRRVQDRAVVT